MIKSKITYENKILNSIANKNDIHNQKESPKSPIVTDKKEQNNSQAEEFDDEENDLSLVEKIKIYHKNNTIKSKQKTVKKLYIIIRIIIYFHC